jgi:hypothetical protein
VFVNVAMNPSGELIFFREDKNATPADRMLEAGRSRVRVPDEVDFFNLPNPSSRTLALGSTQPLTEMSTRNLSGGKERTARRQPFRHL